MSHRYTLEQYKGINSRYNCPRCGKKNQFVRYIDTETNDHISVKVGRCNREVECGYHYTPKQYFQDNKLKPTKNWLPKPIEYKPIKKEASFIENSNIERSMNDYSNNNFVSFLFKNFDVPTVWNAVSDYRIGTSKTWSGANIFWQIDKYNRVRTGKIMLYNSDTGKRIKEPYSKINWVHSQLLKTGQLNEFNLQQCLFGEHLLADNKYSTVAIVESEKTAIICSIFFPKYIWLATGSLSNLNKDKLIHVANRNVILFPDNGAYDKWNSIAKELNFKISDLLELKGETGSDLADYLL